MNILVTGGAGFIGSHLCERLLNEGNEVYCLDNLISGDYHNVSELMRHDNFHYIEGDVIAPPLERIPKVERIFNLACPASPIHYQKDPIGTTKTCFIGALNMLELATENGARILQTSTSEIYGEPLVHPQQEWYRGNVNPIGIRSCYDEGKRVAESLFFDYHRSRGTKIKVVRIFNTYGPNMQPDDGRVVSNFVLQALSRKDITIYGDGGQTRSFCYVSDLVEGLVRMMESDESFTGPVNLGNPSERTIRELAEMIIRLTKSSSKVIFVDLPSDDPTRRRPDISLAKEKLGWEPEVDIEEGLSRTIEYFRSRKKA